MITIKVSLDRDPDIDCDFDFRNEIVVGEGATVSSAIVAYYYALRAAGYNDESIHKAYVRLMDEGML